jgi:hypothetical protein
MPLVDTLAFFFWTGLSAIKIVFAVPLLYVRRSSTNRRIHRINASAEYGMVEAAKPPSDDQKEAPAADADDPRMWGAYDRRMDQLARKWIFPLAVFNYNL